MKLLTVTRHARAGSSTTPPRTTGWDDPVTLGGTTRRSTGVQLTSTILAHAGALALHVTRRPADGCSGVSLPCPSQPLNCCSSSALSCVELSVIVTRLLPKGCTVNAAA